MPANRRTLALEQLFRRDQQAWAARVSATVQDLYGGVDPDDLRTTIERFTGSASVAIRAGQIRSATMAQGFLRALYSLERHEPFELAAAPLRERIPGYTIDGRPLREGLSAVGPAIFVALSQGRSMDQALGLGLAGAARFAATEVLDAGRREIADQGEASGGKLAGWCWVCASAGGCAACLAMANNEVHEWGEPMEAHPWCTCIRSPVPAGIDDVVQRPTGQDIYDSMTRGEQAETFHSAGEQKAELVAAGGVSLDDLVQRSTAEEWRATVYERPLSDVDTGE